MPYSGRPHEAFNRTNRRGVRPSPSASLAEASKASTGCSAPVELIPYLGLGLQLRLADKINDRRCVAKAEPYSFATELNRQSAPTGDKFPFVIVDDER